MMRKIIIILLMSCIFGLQAQKLPMYFIVAHPYDSGGDKEFEAWYMKLEKTGDSLKKIKQLSTPDYKWDFVKTYTDQGFAVMERFHKQKNEVLFGYIDFKNPEEIKELNTTVDYYQHGLRPSVLRKYINNEYNFLLFLIGGENSLVDTVGKVFINIKLPSLQTITGSVNQYTEGIIIGQQGILMDITEGISGIYDSTLNVIKLPLTRDFSKRPIFPIDLPKENMKGIERVQIEINNENFISMVLAPKLKIKNKKFNLTTHIRNLIINKKTKKYFEINFKGNNTDTRSFEKYITGAVAQKTIDSSKKYYYWESPGKAERRQAATKTGLPFDWRCKRDKRHYPSILFVLNTETQQYIEWDTKQGDSEILLIENDTITYRVNDKILQRSLINMKLGEPTLLTQGEFVPDIHWAFTSKK